MSEDGPLVFSSSPSFIFGARTLYTEGICSDALGTICPGSTSNLYRKCIVQWLPVRRSMTQINVLKRQRKEG